MKLIVWLTKIPVHGYKQMLVVKDKMKTISPRGIACSAGVFHGRALNNKFSSRIWRRLRGSGKGGGGGGGGGGQEIPVVLSFDSLQPSRASSPKMTATKARSALPLQKYACIAGYTREGRGKISYYRLCDAISHVADLKENIFGAIYRQSLI